MKIPAHFDIYLPETIIVRDNKIIQRIKGIPPLVGCSMTDRVFRLERIINLKENNELYREKFSDRI